MRLRNFITIISVITFITAPLSAQGQLLKKLKQQAEEKILNKSDGLLGNDKSPGDETMDKNPRSTTKQTVPKKMETIKGKPVKNATTSINNSDLLVYKSPSPAFKDIVIQKYNGVPRFGSCDFYNVSSVIAARQPEVAKAMGEKNQAVKLGYNAFLHMAKIHLLKDLFSSMDKTALTPANRNNVEEEVRSRKAQELLYGFAFSMGTHNLKLEYFCDNPSTSGRCSFGGWGGQRADDFTENEKYIDFVEKYLDIILKWSEDFFADGTQTVYMVKQLTKLGPYDFDQNGFWIKLPHRMRNSFAMDYNSNGDNYMFKFLPNTEYGQQMFNKTSQVEYINGEVLFKIDPAKAEALVNNRDLKLQLVSKVKIVFKGLDEANKNHFYPTFSYHFVNSKVEIYEDVQLTNKLGSLDFENLVYKEP